MPSSAGSDTPLESPRSTSGTFGRLFRRFTRRSTDVDDTPDTPASTSTSTILSGAGTPAASSSTVNSQDGGDTRHRRGGSTSVSDTIRGLGREFGGLTVKDAGSSRGGGSSVQAATSTGVSRFLVQDYTEAARNGHTSSNLYAGASSSQQNARTPTSLYAGSTSSPLSPATSYVYAGGSSGVTRAISEGTSNSSAYMRSTAHAVYVGTSGTLNQSAQTPTSPRYANSTTSSPLTPATSYAHAGPSPAARSMSAEGSNSSAYMHPSPPPISSSPHTIGNRNQGIQTPPLTTYSPSPAIMYLDSHPSTPYTYPQHTTPQPQSYGFYSPAPLSPAPLSPSTEVDQPTLAGRIQSLLDSINVFSRSEDSYSSSPSSSPRSSPTSPTPHQQLSPTPPTNPLTSPRRRYDTDVLPDTSSIMVYSPLLPTDMELVELAETVPFGMPLTPGPAPASPLPVAQVQRQEEVQVHMRPSSTSTSGAGAGAGWSSWWPFNAFSS